MYLISLYFDEKTDKQIRSFMKQVAKKTGNTYMIDENVPPHITIAAFESKELQNVIEKLDALLVEKKRGKLMWASVSAFFPHVIYLAPVLNCYLQKTMEEVDCAIKEVDEIRVRTNYQPYNWMPHTTIGKKLTKEEMLAAFEVLQNSFGVLEGDVTKIGLAKTNPYEDIKVWNLEEDTR